MTSTILTSAAERIAQLAVEQFAEHGYDAASLNDIAVRAGIKKASLYAHFASKDALYVVALELALQAELDYVQSQFARNSRSIKAPRRGLYQQPATPPQRQSIPAVLVTGRVLPADAAEGRGHVRVQ